jgi:hypothetical protein
MDSVNITPCTILVQKAIFDHLMKIMKIEKLNINLI